MAGINESKTMLTVNIAVLTVSDTRTLDNDKSGNVLVERIENAGHHLAGRRIIRDDIDVIVAALKRVGLDRDARRLSVEALMARMNVGG